MTIYTDICKNLWRGYDPYYGFPAGQIKPDLQGWGSQHRYLTDTVVTQLPAVIVEVGVWKGASAMEMARAVQQQRLDAVVIAVDTWLGSWDHWLNLHWYRELGFEFGYPTIYRTFLANMILGGVNNVVLPLPLDSVNAHLVLKHFDIAPDIVHIDGGHDFPTVTNDLTIWWNMLRPGGTLIMDDYYATEDLWPDVRRAVDQFLQRTPHSGFETEENKCRFVRPLA